MSSKKPPKARSRSLAMPERQPRNLPSRTTEDGYNSDDGRGDESINSTFRPDTPRFKSTVNDYKFSGAASNAYMRPTIRTTLPPPSTTLPDRHFQRADDNLVGLNRERVHQAPQQNALNPVDEFIDMIYATALKIRPHLLDIMLVSVFILLLIATLSVWHYKQQRAIDPQSARFIVCDSDLSLRAREHAMDKGDCLDHANLETGLRIVRQIKKMLYDRMKQRLCSDPAASDAIGYRELSNELRNKFEELRYKNLHNELCAAKHLILQNPKWDIAVKLASTTLTLSGGNGERYSVAMAEEPNFLRWQCSLISKLRKFFYIVGIIVPLAIVGLVIYAGKRYYKQRQQHKELQVKEYTEVIIRELQNRAELPGQQQVIVNHLREELLPLQDRTKHLWAWNEAVKLLESNDSRINCGLTMLNGEEYMTMKWNRNEEPKIMMPNSPAANDESKEYLSRWRLVETSPSSTFMPKHPTNCLKITEMFNSHHAKQPDLRIHMRKAIHYKVGSQCKIEEFNLNFRKFCIYVRFKTLKDAEWAYNALCGWSYNNHLIGIRYIKYNPEHYIEQ